MLYKTIVLSLLEQRPVLYDRHRRLRTLLEALDRYSLELKSRHEGWKHRLRQTRPDSDESQLAAEALEIALKELEEHLPTESSTDAAGS